MSDADPFCPRHGRRSRPIEVPGLHCDCSRPCSTSPFATHYEGCECSVREAEARGTERAADILYDLFAQGTVDHSTAKRVQGAIRAEAARLRKWGA